jgi:hypothetical protein
LTENEQQKIKDDDEDFCQCVEPKAVAKKDVRKSAEFKMRILSKKKS